MAETAWLPTVSQPTDLVFYRADEESKTVALLAIMDGRQSVETLLYEVVVLL